MAGSRSTGSGTTRFGALLLGAFAMAGCNGASRPERTTLAELARLSRQLRSLQARVRKQSEKIARLEERLKEPAVAVGEALGEVRPTGPASVEPSGGAGGPAEPLESLPGPAREAGTRPRVAADEFTRKVQRALKRADFDPGPVDGRKGPLTTAAIKAFQRDNNLPETGRADEATWAELKRWLD